MDHLIVEERVRDCEKAINKLEVQIAELRADLKPIKLLAYAGIGTILMSVLTGIIALILK